jgi:hypothetical protein
MEIDDHEAECNPARAVVDLSPFCGDEDGRPEFSQPFSRGEYSYATNGAVCIRIPRRDDIPEIEGTPDPSVVFAENKDASYRRLIINLPDETEAKCPVCLGRGRLHPCPDCECRCLVCEDGKVSADSFTSVNVAGYSFAAHYVRVLIALPKLQVAKPIRGRSGSMLPFRFEGGDGLLMGLHEPGETQIKARISTEAAP